MKRLIPAHGETQEGYKFLFFPMTLKRQDGRYEERCFEVAKIVYQYGPYRHGEGWVPIRWAS